MLNLSPTKQSQLGLSDMMEDNTLQHESKTDIESVNCTFFYYSVAIFSNISVKYANV